MNSKAPRETPLRGEAEGRPEISTHRKKSGQDKARGLWYKQRASVLGGDMERCLLMAILAVQEGLVSAPEVLACLAGVRSGTADLERSLLASGRVTPQQWEDLTRRSSYEERRHGSVERALEALAIRAETLLGSTQTVELPQRETLPSGLRPELAEELGPVTLENPGRYRAVTEIGRGAIGRILATHDYHLGREVALKELLPPDPVLERYDPSRRTMQVIRFLREARVTARLEHPSIVPVYELGARPDGSLYYCMKRLNGRTLHEAIQSASTSEDLRSLLERFFSLCQAIAYAHSKGVIHRDIKPKNVMLGEFGETVLLDWGLAKVMGSPDDPLDMVPMNTDGLSSQETQAGFTVGTPAYMSPEQAAGEREAIDVRADVWSLGVVLFEIMTKTTPFTGRRANEVLEAIANRPVPSPLALRPDLDPDLSAVCMKALTKDVNRRYQTVEELAADIRAYLSGRQVAAYRYSRFEVARKFVRHNPALALLGGALLFALVGGATWITLLFFNSEHHRILAVAEGQEKARALVQVQEEKERVERARLASDQSNREAHQNLSVALEEEAQRRLNGLDFLGADVFAASALLHTPNNPRSPYVWPGLLGDEARRHADEQMANIRSLLYFGEVNRRQKLEWNAALSLEGPRGAARLASGNWGVVDRSGTFQILAQEDRRVLSTEKVGSVIGMVEFSPDGRWGIVRDSKTGTSLFPTSRPAQTQRLGQSWASGLFSARFSSDSKTVILSLESGAMTTMPVAKAADSTFVGPTYFAGNSTPKRTVAISPDGNWIAGGAEDGTLCLADVRGERLERCWTGHVGNVLDLAFSADSLFLISAGFDGCVTKWDVGTAREVWRTHAVEGHIMRVALLGSDKALYIGSHDGWMVLLRFSDGLPLERFRAHQLAVRSLRLLDGGQRLLSLGEDGQLAMWTISTSLARRIDAPGGAVFNHIALASDDHRVASVDTQFRVCLWDLWDSSAPLECQKTGQIWDVSISPDGRWIAVGLSRRQVGLWSLADKKFRTFEPFTGSMVVAVDFTPDSKMLVAASQGVMKVWELGAALQQSTPTPLRSFPVESQCTWDILVDPDGTKVLLTDGGRLSQVSLTDGRVLRRIAVSEQELSSISMAADGNTVAVSGLEGDAYLVDLNAEKVLHNYAGHDAWANTVRISPDGAWLLSGSDDKTFRLWDVKKGTPHIIGDAGAEVLGLDFAHDSGYFLVAIKDTVRVYPILPDATLEDPVALLDAAQSRQGMVLKGFDLVTPQ